MTDELNVTEDQILDGTEVTTEETATEEPQGIESWLTEDEPQAKQEDNVLPNAVKDLYAEIEALKAEKQKPAQQEEKPTEKPATLAEMQKLLDQRDQMVKQEKMLEANYNACAAVIDSYLDGVDVSINKVCGEDNPNKDFLVNYAEESLQLAILKTRIQAEAAGKILTPKDVERIGKEHAKKFVSVLKKFEKGGTPQETKAGAIGTAVKPSSLNAAERINFQKEYARARQEGKLTYQMAVKAREMGLNLNK
jgi:hypothetical protein